MLSGTLDETETTMVCQCLISEITEVSLSPYKQILFQPSALNELENYDGILFLEKRGSSDSSFIRQEKGLL